jgi:hypothetical protein
MYRIPFNTDNILKPHNNFWDINNIYYFIYFLNYSIKTISLIIC